MVAGETDRARGWLAGPDSGRRSPSQTEAVRAWLADRAGSCGIRAEHHAERRHQAQRDARPLGVGSTMDP